MEPYYTIEEIARMSGLTARTLRSYIRQGLLEGEKRGGVWVFTQTQFSEFLSRAPVRRSLRANREGIVRDFLAQPRKAYPQACLILDLPPCGEMEDAARRAQILAFAEDGRLKLRYVWQDGYTRLICTGTADTVRRMLTILEEK